MWKWGLASLAITFMHNLPYNGRKPLIRLPAMKKIARFAAVFAAACVLAGAGLRQNPSTG